MASYDPDYTPRELKRLEKQLEKIPDEEKASLQSGVQKLAKGEALNEQEEAAYNKHLGFRSEDKTGAEEINDKLNKGYTGKKGEKKTRTSKLFNSNSKTKKKIAIAGAAAGGSTLIGVLVFLAMLPLKIEHIVSNLEDHFSATANSALDRETENLYSAYMTKHVLPYINTGTCHTTIDAGCAHVGPDTSPVGKLFVAWKDGRLEQKMATKYGLVFGKRNGQLYLNTNGHDINLRNGENIFDSADGHSATRNEIRRAVRDGLRGATLYDRIYTRFKLGKLLESKYGVKRCVIACAARDNFNDKKDVKIRAAKAYIVQRVISPLSNSYGLIMQCLISGDACSPDLDNAGAGEDTRQTAFQRNLQGQLNSFAEKYGSEKLADLFDKANSVGKNGFTRYFASELSRKVAAAFGKDISGEAAAKAIPVVGQVLLVARVIKTADTLGPTLQYMSYATNAAAAVALYQTYNTVASELKSGHIDPTELGSFTSVLGSNLDGTKDNSSDASSTPLYQSLMGSSSTTSTSASIIASLLSGKAYADSANNTTYTCDDSSSGPSLQEQVCPEEKLVQGNDTLNAISSFVQNTLYQIPGFGLIIDGVNKVGDLVGEAFGTAFSAACNVIPGCSAATNALGDKMSELMDFVVHHLVDSPFAGQNLSGGRTFDMMAAGADVSHNTDCQLDLGCGKISSVTYAQILNRQSADQKSEFDSKSMFARMFSTSDSSSLVSRLAMDMPTDMLATTNTGFMGLLSNPMSKLASAFSGITSQNHAFAATQPQSDPFGVVQYGYTDAQVDAVGDPETYWAANCVNGPLAKYDETTKKLDVSDWINSHQSQDPNTGEPVNTDTNPCLLLQSSVQSSGGAFDASLLPADSTSSAPAGGASGPTSKSAPSYCSDGSAQGGQKIVCSAFLFDDFGYSYGGGHVTGSALKSLVDKVRACVSSDFGTGCTYTKYQQIVDCSSMVDAAIYDATGKDLMQGASTGSYPSNSHLQLIDISQAQAGDVAWWDSPDGHTEIIVSYDAASHVVQTMGAHGGSPGADDNGPDSYPNSWGPLPQKVFRVVP